MESSDDNIRVFVRVRPSDSYEDRASSATCVDVTGSNSLIVQSKPEPKTFTFDHVASPDTTQEEVFLSVGKPIIDGCISGYNGTIFAYGQTGSGKTFTMIGPCNDDSTDAFTHELRGIIPRSFEYLFSLISREKQKCGDMVEFLCKCSFLEIYNEQVYDLLDPISSGLHLRESISKGVYVDGLIEVVVSSATEAYQVLTKGWINRRVASTSMNRESSRSHAVFMLCVESKQKDCDNSVSKIRSSVLNLVDLAGSERQRDTQAVGVRLKEAGNINRSLSALGNVIMSLVDIGHGKSRHVHYRDSKLTFLLRDSIGGNARTHLIANIHPIARCFGESLSTLQFARRAKLIKNKAVINEDTTGNVAQLQAEIKKLKEKLRAHSNANCSVSVHQDAILHGTVAQDDERQNEELQQLLATALERKDQTESEKRLLLKRVDELEELCRRKDKVIQTRSMMLKLRDSHIVNLEKRSKGEITPQCVVDEHKRMLCEENGLLKANLDHHPDATKFAIENSDLKAEVKRLQKLVASDQVDSIKQELAKLQQYSVKLERQMKVSLTNNELRNTEASLSMEEYTTQLTSEVERLEKKCKQLQNQLSATQETLNDEVKLYKGKIMSLETNLEASNKMKYELEKTLEAVRLKHAVERDSMNESNLKIARVLLTPRSAKKPVATTCKSTSTPFNNVKARTSRQRLFFPPLSSIQHDPPKATPTDDVSTTTPTVIPNDGPPTATPTDDQSTTMPTVIPNDGPPTVTPTDGPLKAASSEVVDDDMREVDRGLVPVEDIGEDEDIGDDGNIGEDENIDEDRDIGEDGDISGAEAMDNIIIDELKNLQNSNSDLHKQLEAKDAEILNIKSSYAVAETQLSSLLSQLAVQKATVSDLEERIAKHDHMRTTFEANKNVLEEEVRDLKLCLTSADNELQELKRDMITSRTQWDILQAELYKKIDELEQSTATKSAEYQNVLESYQEMQDEVETLRDEVLFKDHCLQQKEGEISTRQEIIQTQETELQSLQEQLAVEIDKMSTLTCQMKEDSQKELAAALNENSLLTQEVNQLKIDMEQKLATYQTELDSALSTIQTLKRGASEDKDAITGLMSTVRQLREVQGAEEANMAALRLDYETRDEQLKECTDKLDKVTAELQTLHIKCKEQISKHDKEIRAKEMLHEMLVDEVEEYHSKLDELTGLCQQLQNTVSVKTEEVEALREQLQQAENKTKQHKAIDQLANSSFVYVESESERINQLETERITFTDSIDELQSLLNNKNTALHILQSQVSDYDDLKREHDLLRTQLMSTKYKMEADSEEHLNREASLKQALNDAQIELHALQEERQQIIKQADFDKSSIAAMTKEIIFLEEQLQRIKGQEEVNFQEKEALRSQLEAYLEERAKLDKEHHELVRENALLSGHRNHKQKIQFHAKLKVEYHKLLEDHRILQEKHDELCQKMEGSSGTDDTKRVLRNKTRHLKQIKENVYPV